MLSIYLWLAVLLIIWINFLWRRKEFYMLQLKLPGPMGYPLIGLAYKLLRKEEILQMFNKYEKIYGYLFVSWLGPIPFLVVCEPQIAQDVLTSPYCVDKSFLYDVIEDGTGPGLFSLKNPEWNIHRKLLNPAFKHSALLRLIILFNEAVDALMIDLVHLEYLGEVDVTSTLQNFALNLTTMTLMGNENAAECKGQWVSLLKNFHCILDSMNRMCFSPWLRYRVIQYFSKNYWKYSEAKNKMRSFICEMINKRMLSSSSPYQDKRSGDLLTGKLELNNTYEANNHNTFIDLAINLMKKGDFTWKQVEDEANVMVFGAFETTTNTLYYTLMLLAMFPSYQEKLFEEIHTILGNHGQSLPLSSPAVTYENIQSMTYMDMVISEVMRVMAPVPIVARQSTREIILSNGIKLPRGLQIAIDIFHMHRREDVWGSEAHTFNPDHFLPSNMEGRHSYAFIPFTKGIRNCIGWRYALTSIKITLARILLQYQVTTSFKYHDLEFVEDVTLKLKRTALLEFHPRSNVNL